MTRDYTLFVKDILDAIKAIEKFVGNSNYKDFLKDDKTKSAIVWKLSVYSWQPREIIPLKMHHTSDNISVC